MLEGVGVGLIVCFHLPLICGAFFVAPCLASTSAFWERTAAFFCGMFACLLFGGC